MPESISSEYLSATASGSKWERLKMLKRAGVSIPLFSVYSKNTLGIGDLEDLKAIVDWCSQTGNSILQLMPINEMGVLFCPYDSISSFSLEPAYLYLRGIPQAKNRKIALQIDKLKNSFPCGRASIDFNIKKEKLRLLREIYRLGIGPKLPEFNKFKEENAYWLLDFSLYKVLKEYYKGLPWYDWEEKFRDRHEAMLQDFQEEHKEEISFVEWVQWLIFTQLKEAKKYAKDKGVLIKGDLPILVSRDSADVWQHPEFFKLDFVAGAPSDMYCAKGQRWGMPPYNWQRIAQDGYKFLKERLRFAQEFYDILRIDHVVGLFRIWSIPYQESLESKGLNGFFEPRDEKLWGEQGKKILSVMLDNTNMLLCAEDLGVIPQVCKDTLKELGIPGSDVQRWTKDWKVKHDFLAPKEYRPLSVAMLSTHDTTNWPAWRENEAGTVDEALFIRKCNDRKIYYSQVKDKLFNPALSFHARLRWLKSIDSVDKLVSILGKKKEELMDFIEMYENSYQEKEKLWLHLGINGPMREKCDPEILHAALKISLDSSSVFCINSIIDYLYLGGIFKGDPYQYRINTPGTINSKNWSLTLPISLEELLRHTVNKEIRSLITESGRI
ncbi:MAG: 4-alpha-glucanotransferase [Candidatus Omnitrophica bacterium]|nr:4-alpha-glucanotransferase [Candidatus Omnitrophota bacterium]